MEQIEQSIVKGLLFNEDYARTVYPYLKSEYFDGATKYIFDNYSLLFDRYNKIPSVESMIVSLQKSNKLDESMFIDCANTIEECIKSRNDAVDVDWLKDETENYCKDKAIYQAIYKSISIIEGSDKVLDLNAIPELLDTALSVSFDTSIGSDYFDDMMKRYTWYTSEEARIKFPIEALNKLSNGGLPAKTLNVILAGTNVGKSALMCWLAGEWLRMGYNVLYITMEMSEEAIQQRVDANLMNIKTDELSSLSEQDFINRVQKLKNATNGRFVVKEYPTGSAHAGHFRLLLKELKQKKKFKPDVIIIDYINICSSSRYKGMAGVNSYSYIKAIAEELRGLGVEFEVPVLSATQVNREGAGSQSPDMTSVSDSFGLSMTVDWMMALVTNEELMAMKNMLCLLLKTRYSNKSVAKNQMIGVDYDYMRFSDVTDASNPNSVSNMQNNMGNKTPEQKEDKKSKIEQWEY